MANEEPTANTDKADAKRSLGGRANANLREARRTLESIEWQPDDKPAHLLAEARVLALLDLAEAIRERRAAAAGRPLEPREGELIG